MLQAVVENRRWKNRMLRWYDVVDIWCREPKVTWDYERHIVAPPPRPPPDYASTAATPWGARPPSHHVRWEQSCHRWWAHVTFITKN